jgi:hypothetical protein
MEAHKGPSPKLFSRIDSTPLALGPQLSILILMTTQQAKALRNKINALALDLELANSKAEVRCIKEAIRAAEIELTNG